MIGEIDGDFYCGVDCYDNGRCKNSNPIYDCDVLRVSCPAFRRKWPTPEQFREEYGREYDTDRPVWALLDCPNPKWVTVKYDDVDYEDPFGLADDGFYARILSMVCVCTPWGKPPDDWRPR